MAWAVDPSFLINSVKSMMAVSIYAATFLRCEISFTKVNRKKRVRKLYNDLLKYVIVVGNFTVIVHKIFAPVNI